MYILEAMFEYFISILTTGAYLAKLTTAINISDSMTAVLSSVTSLAGMFQLVSIFLSHKTPVKRWVLPINFLTQAMVSTLYVLPFLSLGKVAPVIFFVIMLVSRAGVNVVSPAKSNWFLSLIDDRHRGDFQAKLTIVSLAGGMIFTLAASALIDNFEAAEDIEGAFIVMTVAICILTVIQISCLIFAKEKPIEVKKSESPFKSLGSLLNNKIYRRIIIINFLWAIASNLTTPFLSTFQIKELGFSMTFISAVGVILSLFQMLVIYLFGRYSVRHSYSSILRIAYIFAAVQFVFVAFSTRENGYVVFTGYRVMAVLFGSASSVSSTSLLFNVVPERERTSALAINTMFTGLAGFLITLIASPFVDFMQTLNLSLFGMQIYVQQILAIVSLVITLGIIFYYNVFCHKLIKNN